MRSYYHIEILKLSQLSLNDSFIESGFKSAFIISLSNKTYLNVPFLFYFVFKVKMMTQYFLHIHKLSHCTGADSIAESVARPILTGYPTTLFTRRSSSPARDVSLSNNSSTP
jgi:hypothetical protein